MKKDASPKASPKEQPPRHQSTPFKRGRSKVFYASDTTAISPVCPTNGEGPYTGKRDRRTANPNRPVSVISEGNENVVNSADEKSSLDCSPSGSWRGFECASPTIWRCSPSQRSQDSGYSDSGESNSGVQTESEESITLPQVKHITRVYFGDCHNSDGQCVSCSQPNIRSSLIRNNSSGRTFKTAKRRCNSTVNLILNKTLPETGSNSILKCKGMPKSLSFQENINASHHSLVLDEADVHLEHKSLLPTSTPNPNSKKKISKHFFKTFFSEHKGYKCDTKKLSSKSFMRLPHLTPKKTSCSTEMLLDSPDSVQQPDCSNTKRRWSTSVVDRCSYFNAEVDLGSMSGSEEKILEDELVVVDVSKSLSNTHIEEEQKANYSIVIATDSSELFPFQMASQINNSSLGQWLKELHNLYEPECMNTLQSKSIGQDKQPVVTCRVEHVIATVQKKAHHVSTEFALLCQKLENLQLDRISPLVQSLVACIRKFINEQCEINADDAIAQKDSLDHQVRVVDQICTKLLEICSEFVTTCDKLYVSKRTVMNKDDDATSDEGSDREIIREFVKIVTALGHAFTKLVDILLSMGIQSIVKVLEESENISELQNAISQITALGVDGGHVCRLVARSGGIRALLSICLERSKRKLRSLVLRALATVSCVAEGIAYFEKDGGIEVITEVLCDKECPEDERSEAAGVLAQITSPWVEDNVGSPCLTGHLEQLVSALKNLAQSTNSMEAFLLACAALANLTFLDGNSAEIFLKTATHKVLLEKANSNPDLAVFIKDQIATVLANLSNGSAAAKEVVDADGLMVLVSFLNTRPTASNHLPEVDATERVQQKTAIALSRLSTEQRVAQEIIQLGGAERLVRLCKDEKERNFSDAVLVACLAALRKIASACGHEELRGVDASELVEPKLLDSFLIYSSQQESYV